MRKSLAFLLAILIALSLLSACANKATEAAAPATNKETLTDKELDSLDKVSDEMAELRESSEYQSADNSEKATVVIAKLDELADNKLIYKESIYYDDEDQVVTWQCLSGVGCVFRINDWQEGYAGLSVSSNVGIPYIGTIDTQPQMVPVSIGTNKGDAVAFCAWGTAPEDSIVGVLQQQLGSYGFTASLDNSLTLEDLSNLQNFEFVYIGAHGSHVNLQIVKSTIPIFPNIILKEASYVHTKQKKDRVTSLRYSRELKSLAVIVDFSSDCYAISEDFFASQYSSNELSDTIIFISSCEVMGKHGVIYNSWKTSLESVGVRAFVAFHNSVIIGYGASLADEFARQLSNDHTVQESLTAATNKHGKTDLSWAAAISPERITDEYFSYPAYPIIGGNANAKLPCFDNNNNNSSSTPNQQQSSSAPVIPSISSIPGASSIQYSGDWPACLPKPSFAGMTLLNTEQMFEWMSAAVPSESDITNYVSQIKANGYTEIEYADEIMAQVGSSMDQALAMYKAMGIDFKMLFFVYAEGHCLVMDYCFYKGIGACVIIMVPLPISMTP